MQFLAVDLHLCAGRTKTPIEPDRRTVTRAGYAGMGFVELPDLPARSPA
jgi:hypothetical protein